MSTKKSLNDISFRIKLIRKKNNLTQQVFAKELGVKQGHISGIEQGKAMPSDTFIIALCYHYSINKEWLLNGTGEMESIKDATQKYDSANAFANVLKIFEDWIVSEKVEISHTQKAKLMTMLCKKLT